MGYKGGEGEGGGQGDARVGWLGGDESYGDREH